MLNLTLHHEREAVTIRSFTDDAIVIDESTYHTSLLLTRSTVTPQTDIQSVDDLNSALAEQLIAAAPEVVLIGTGRQHTFPSPAFLGQILSTGTGCEVMSTAAGCRTHNVLASEGRKVASLLILD